MYIPATPLQPALLGRRPLRPRLNPFHPMVRGLAFYTVDGYTDLVSKRVGTMSAAPPQPVTLLGEQVVDFTSAGRVSFPGAVNVAGAAPAFTVAGRGKYVTGYQPSVIGFRVTSSYLNGEYLLKLYNNKGFFDYGTPGADYQIVGGSGNAPDAAINTLIGVTPPTGLQALWENGVKTAANNNLGGITYNGNGEVSFTSAPNGSSGYRAGTAYFCWGAIWERALSDDEALELTHAPYAPMGIPLLLESTIPEIVCPASTGGGATDHSLAGTPDMAVDSSTSVLSVTRALAGTPDLTVDLSTPPLSFMRALAGTPDLTVDLSTPTLSLTGATDHPIAGSPIFSLDLAAPSVSLTRPLVGTPDISMEVSPVPMIMDYALSGTPTLTANMSTPHMTMVHALSGSPTLTVTTGGRIDNPDAPDTSLISELTQPVTRVLAHSVIYDT